MHRNQAKLSFWAASGPRGPTGAPWAELQHRCQEFHSEGAELQHRCQESGGRRHRHDRSHRFQRGQMADVPNCSTAARSRGDADTDMIVVTVSNEARWPLLHCLVKKSLLVWHTAKMMVFPELQHRCQESGGRRRRHDRSHRVPTSLQADVPNCSTAARSSTDFH